MRSELFESAWLRRSSRTLRADHAGLEILPVLFRTATTRGSSLSMVLEGLFLKPFNSGTPLRNVRPQWRQGKIAKMTALIVPMMQSPDILVGERERQRLVVAALTDITQDADRIDFLLYELDRAKVIPDDRLPFDVVRLNSIVRFRSEDGECTVKLVVPDENGRIGQASYRLSVTSRHGAALLGLRPGQTLSWLSPEGISSWVEVVSVANAPNRHVY
ncbi:GreA/GreB family elongation factor [Devosia rhizoryzae]|uniref:GreA/GreB family elongation factor n=1 Tax=Devosia rhizoryzae TaxID=2774137 RepID=A0ABX7C241_9HYPH|nr:GreA/GreB family elongation factor [Devosia rhizoryzae]QQR38298.1 GreA/GreB family elongation factor [Devosia rhizoryzae]